MTSGPDEPRSSAAATNSAAMISPDGVMTLFAMLWGAASIFHVLGTSGRTFGVLVAPTALGISQMWLCFASLWLIVQPRKIPPLLIVAVLGLLTLWLETPALGNHWLLAGFVNLALVVSVILARGKGKVDRQAVAQSFLPVARMCLIGFYSFAAFAKLNSAFFDTTVSCSTLFFDETARSFGFNTPLTVGAGGLAAAIPIAAAITELSVPLLLLGRRTRVAGVLVGLTFHSVIALNRIHPFIDFSAVLAALFVLFLAPQFAERALAFLEGKGRRPFAILLGLTAAILAVQWFGNLTYSTGVFSQARMILWFLTDATILAGVFLWVARNRRAVPSLDHPFVLPKRGRKLLKIVPALLVLNGLFVYMELRTAFSYTMYSNLRMVDGESNHFIVRDSFPVGDRHADRVTVVATNDPGLAGYVGTGFEIAWDSFRAYLSRNPDIAVTFDRAGERRVLLKASDDPKLVDPPPVVVQKLFPLRAVDSRNPPRCQNVFLPAL